MIRTLCILSLLALLVAIPIAANAGSYSTDFESYAYGDLVGQDGWVDDSAGPGILPSVIIDDPTGAGHGKVVKMEYGDIDANWSGAFRSVGDLVAEGYKNFSLSWDQYRLALHDNVWIAEDISYSGWWGIEWDMSSNLHINNNFDNPQGALTANQWQNIRINFDVAADTAEGFIDGVSFGTATGVSLATFRGIDLEVSGTEAGGGNAGPVYFDNINITAQPVPEPSSLVAIMTGLVGLGFTLRRRTR